MYLYICFVHKSAFFTKSKIKKKNVLIKPPPSPGCVLYIMCYEREACVQKKSSCFDRVVSSGVVRDCAIKLKSEKKRTQTTIKNSTPAVSCTANIYVYLYMYTFEIRVLPLCTHPPISSSSSENCYVYNVKTLYLERVDVHKTLNSFFFLQLMFYLFTNYRVLSYLPWYIFHVTLSN